MRKQTDSPNSSKVLITIYDIHGREVRTLVNGEKARGYHAVVWDGQNSLGQRVVGGVYFYQIDAMARTAQDHHFRDVKKMIFMK
jgi:flagellar hook assembly protein FlgD